MVAALPFPAVALCGMAIFSPLRPIGALAALAALAPLGACGKPPAEQTVVSVIGEPPELREPGGAPLTAGEELLLANVAQGLVRFDGQGRIEPGLAERWNVSDDGLSYIFRLAAAEWPGGDRITAAQVARMLRRNLSASPRGEIADLLGAVDEIVAMTDRVLEIRLLSPRPHLLQLLAQPQLALLHDGEGSGPFTLAPGPAGDTLVLRRKVGPGEDGSPAREERVVLRGEDAAKAIRRFIDGRAQLVLGGTYLDLPLARAANPPRASLRFDPAAGLFGLVPGRSGGPIADAKLRDLLNRSIDRTALVAALAVPGLVERATLLQPGLAGLAEPVAPIWASEPLAGRRAALVAEAEQMFAGKPRPQLRVDLGEGPGGRLLLFRLAADWKPLGVTLLPAQKGVATDLKLLDAVAPSDSPAWFLRRFRCEAAPICSEQADELLAAARGAAVQAQRDALFAAAEQEMAEAQLFMPIAAPVRWSLVARELPGFFENSFARHTLVGLGSKRQ